MAINKKPRISNREPGFILKPLDFSVSLIIEEFANLRSQIRTSSRGGSRWAKPYAFTDQGVDMLTSLNAKPFRRGFPVYS